MPNTLETYVQRDPVQDENVYRVFYRVVGNKDNISKVRAVDVPLPLVKEDPAKLAELLAIKYILLHSSHVGACRSGAGLTILVSNGSIRKVQKKLTTNKDMIHHGTFLGIRFADSVIKTARNFDWAKGFKGNAQRITEDMYRDEVFSTPAGDVILTAHAVERYMGKMKVDSMDRSWRRLTKLISEGRWAIAKPPRPMKGEKIPKTSETWAIRVGRERPVNAVIVKNIHGARLVTVYPGFDF